MSDDNVTTSVPVDAAQTTPAPTSAPAPTPATTPAEDAPSQAQPTSGETRQSLLEAVQSAVPELKQTTQEDGDGSGVSPTPTAQTDPTSPDVDDDGTLPDEITDAEMAKYALSAKRRIRRLWNQRRELREQVDKLKSIEPQAQAADSVSTYLKDNDISRDDFLMMLELGGALRRGEWQKFVAGMTPYMNLAEEALGQRLPPDLQNAVRHGQMTTEAAAHFSRERMSRMLLESKHQRSQQQAVQQQQYFENQQQKQQREVLANQVRDHVNAWERTAMQHDPEYAAKRAAVQDTMWAVVREQGAPRSPDHAVGIAREAYRRVNERYRSWAPPKRPTSRSPSSTGRSTGAAPEAKSLLDVVRQARENARAS